jgi:glucosamine--fructose-6-phosphate aminotransferase (isomerizing)
MVAFPDPRTRHPFYMYEMIHAQPDAVDEAIGRVRASSFAAAISGARHLRLTGCGTSFHAAMYGEMILQSALGRDCRVESVQAYDVANERKLPGNATLVAVSHSGTTPSTNRAAVRAKRAGWRVLGVCGLPGSPLEEIADDVLVLGSTHDRSWANTMSYTSQLSAFAALASQNQPGRSDLDRGIRGISNRLRTALSTDRKVRALARSTARADRITFLGAGWDEITALEGALKIRETCGLNASAYHPEQFLHGPFLSIERGEPVVALRSREEGARADVLRRALTRSGAKVTIAGEHASASIPLPAVHPALRPIVSVVPLQLLAYHAAVARHANPDIMRTDIPRFRSGVAALFR